MIPRGYVKWLRIWRGRAALAWLRAEARGAAVLGVRGLHLRHLASRVSATGLFDAQWYLENNPDVRDDGVDPLAHYVRHGDREGRQPMALFDPAFYRAHAGESDTAPNTLLHFALLGRFRKLPASAWFDTEFYLRQNRDVAKSGVDPLRHYVESGGAEGRSPCRLFDAAFYLRTNPDVAEAGVNPLLHYLRFGRLEGRQVTATEWHERGEAPVTRVEPVPAGWDDVVPVRAAQAPVVDVVVPVYKGLAETMRCLRSVLFSRNVTPFELVVIDDAGPDAALGELLAAGAAAGLFTLLSNPANAGFVVTANRGMALHADRDVVLLNADTEVFGDWLDRLRAAAQGTERTATVTPLSNNATIASYPRVLHDNPYPLEIPFAELDRLAAALNAGVAVEAPTGVGFCMYIRREAIDAIGPFDEEAFGRGYGEENDFCQRAVAQGFRNLITADVFVHHLGSVSFQGERARRVADAMRVLERRYPSYHRDVRAFIESDPLAGVRQRLDWARLGREARERNVLLVCHNRGGGAERHLREDTARLLARGLGVFYLRPAQPMSPLVRVSDPRRIQLPNQPHLPLEPRGALLEALRDLRIAEIHVHGTVDFPAGAPGVFVELAEALGARLEVDVHDYQVLCPRINLANETGRYCGEPDASGCAACLAVHGSKYGVVDIDEWRALHARMLRAAAVVWVPDPDVGERLARYHEGLALAVEPHEDLAALGRAPRPPALAADEALHVVVIGAIGKVKGFDVLLACARDARDRRLPLRFSVLGYTMNDAALAQAGVRVSGRYLEDEGDERLAAIGAHVAWLPSLWPETYSYTLSLALRAGLPVFAFDIGAIARRLRELGREQGLAALELHTEPRELNARFLDYRAARAGQSRAVVA